MNKIDLSIFKNDFLNKNEISLKIFLFNIFNSDYDTMLKFLEEFKEVNFFLGYTEKVFIDVLNDVSKIVNKG